jgi:hypothetical protein
MTPQVNEHDAILLLGERFPASSSMPVSRDLQLILGPYRPHTMLIGADDRTASILGGLHAGLTPPVRVHDCAVAAAWPDDARTIILRNLDTLDLRSQHALMARLDAAPRRVQIISVAEQSAFALVQRGQFLEALYRRLSLIYLSLEAPDPD